MVPAPSSLAPPLALQDSVEVGVVSGGQPTNPLWTSQVDNEAFRAALIQALAQAHLFHGDTDGVRYRLDADLLGLEQPTLGFDFTVTATVNYELMPLAGGEPFKTTIARPYTASMGRSFLAVERLRMANEGAIRANIAALIDELSAHYQQR